MSEAAIKDAYDATDWSPEQINEFLRTHNIRPTW